MHDTVRVRIVQRIRDLAHQPDHFANGLARAVIQARPERLSFDERHGEERDPFCRAGGEKRDDVWMLETGDERDFALKAQAANC